MAKEGKDIHPKDIGKTDISLLKLINYNLLFFIPLMLSVLLSLWLGTQLSGYFDTSATIVSRIFMFIFTFMIFSLIIPFIRRREKVSGIRYSILAFFIVGIGLVLPSAIQGNFDLLFSLLHYFGHYVLLTFIFAPEVLGIHSNLADWFAKGKQIIVLVVYVAIVFFYVIGFGTFYTEIHVDNDDAFAMGFEKEASMGTFMYYSIVTFATIGYGEITPVSTAARAVASLEIMFGMIINVLFIAMLLVYISSAQSYILKKEEKEIKKEEQDIREVKAEVKKIEKAKEEDMDELLNRIKSL